MRSHVRVHTTAGLVLASVALSAIGSFTLAYNTVDHGNKSEANVAGCKFIQTDYLEYELGVQNLTRAAGPNFCTFVSDDGNQLISITTEDDPAGLKFQQSARAISCDKNVPMLEASSSCTGPKEDVIFFHKKFRLVTVKASPVVDYYDLHSVAMDLSVAMGTDKTS